MRGNENESLVRKRDKKNIIRDYFTTETKYERKNDQFWKNKNFYLEIF